jgi:hypothetical protein
MVRCPCLPSDITKRSQTPPRPWWVRMYPLIHLLNNTNCSAHEETISRTTPAARRTDLAFKMRDLCCLSGLYCLAAENAIRTAGIKSYRGVVMARDEVDQLCEPALTEKGTQLVSLLRLKDIAIAALQGLVAKADSGCFIIEGEVTNPGHDA